MKEKITFVSPLLALVLVGAYTFLPDAVIYLPIFSHILNFEFYLLTIACYLVIVIPALILLYQIGRWQQINAKNFRWSYLAYALLTCLMLYAWNFASAFFLPPTQNASSYNQTASSFTGATIFLMRFLYPVILAPIFEEVIYRGLVMTALEKGKTWGLDVLGSSALFVTLHLVGYTWSWVDFIFYFVGGLLFDLLFKVTKSIYWTSGTHMAYNGVMQILMLL